MKAGEAGLMDTGMMLLLSFIKYFNYYFLVQKGPKKKTLNSA